MGSHLEDYVQSLSSADPQDDAAFLVLLRRAFETLRLTDTDLSREFGMSRPTVTRWRNGVTTPHPALRKPLYAWLLRRARSRVRVESGGSSAAISRSPMAARGRS